MILIADGGSTKTDWRIVDNELEIKQIQTKGINPYIRSSDEINKEITDILSLQLKGYDISQIYFFGAGCNTAEKQSIIKNILLREIDNIQEITVESDLLGAAIGLCGDKKGIACILGTGSNSCLYDGKEIVEHVSPLGYILGDEGSGAVLGRIFVNACLKNQLSEDIKKSFLEEYKLTPSLLLDKVYRDSMPNRFLASISPFILKNIQNEKIHDLVYSSFKEFFVKNVMQYSGWNNLAIHMTGSVAYHYKDVVVKVGTELGLHITTITQSPMQGVIEFFSKKQ